MGFEGTFNIDTKAIKFGYSNINIRYGLFDNTIGELIRIVYKYIPMHLSINFIDYFPNFLSRNRLYNICLKFQYIGIKGVIFKASRYTGFF